MAEFNLTVVGMAVLAAKDGFQGGQTAKARSGHRVQSLLKKDMAAQQFLPHKRIHLAGLSQKSGRNPTDTMPHLPCRTLRHREIKAPMPATLLASRSGIKVL